MLQSCWGFCAGNNSETGCVFPIRHGRSEIVDHSLAIFAVATETRLRARGVRETQHSVTVADAGSNPAGSILPCGGEIHLRRKRRDNLLLTLPASAANIAVDRVLTTRLVYGSRFRGPFFFLREIWRIRRTSGQFTGFPTPFLKAGLNQHAESTI